MPTLYPDPSGPSGGLTGVPVDGIYFGGLGGTQSVVPAGGTWNGRNLTYFTPAGILLQQNNMTVQNATFYNPYSGTFFPTKVTNHTDGTAVMTFPIAMFSPTNPDGGFGNFQINQQVQGPGISKTGTVFVTAINPSASATTGNITLTPTGGATIDLPGVGPGYAFLWVGRHGTQEFQVQPIVRTIPVNASTILTGINLTAITALGVGIGTYQSHLVGCAGFDILSTDSLTMSNCSAINCPGDSLTTFMVNPGGYPPCTNLLINHFTSTNPGREGWTCSAVNGGTVNYFNSTSGGEHDLDFESDLGFVGAGNLVINHFTGDTGIQFNEQLTGPITFNELTLAPSTGIGCYFTVNYEAAGRGPTTTALITVNNSSIVQRYHSSGTPPASIYVDPVQPPFNTVTGENGQVQFNNCTLTRAQGQGTETPAWIVENYSSIVLCNTTWEGPEGEVDSTSSMQINGPACNPTPPAPPVFTSANHATFTEFIQGSFTLQTSGSPPPTFSVTAGALPTGVTMINGHIAGQAQESGTFPVTFAATNVNGTAHQNFTLTVNANTGGPVFTSAAATTFFQDVFDQFTVQTVGTPDAALFLIGQLPEGITFNDNGDGTATLSGVPVTSGTFGFSYVATNVVGSATQLFSLTIQGENFNMALTKQGFFAWAGGGKNGALVDMWAADRFASPPAEGDPPPDGNPPDAGPVTTGINFGGPGAYSLVVPFVQDYYQRVQYGGVAYWGSVPAGTIAGQPQFAGSAGVISYLSFSPNIPYTMTANTLTAIDAANLTIPSFVAPSTGNILVEWSCLVADPTPVGCNFGLLFTATAGSAPLIEITVPSGTGLYGQGTYSAIVSDLTVGEVYSLALATEVVSGSVSLSSQFTATVTAI